MIKVKFIEEDTATDTWYVYGSDGFAYPHDTSSWFNGLDTLVNTIHSVGGLGIYSGVTRTPDPNNKVVWGCKDGN